MEHRGGQSNDDGASLWLGSGRARAATPRPCTNSYPWSSFPTLRYRLVTGDSVESHAAFSVGAAQKFDEVPDVPVSGCPPPNMSKRTVNLNGSPDSRLGSAALHFVSMPPERFDWSDRHAPQAAPPQAGLAPAGLAEAAPPPSGAAAPGTAVRPDLVVRTRRSVHQFQPGATCRIGRDPDSDIVMTDSRVSWRHGVLRTDGDAWIFEDLGSTNGTFLGTERIDRAEIGNDCVVRLGNPDDGPILRCTPQASAAPAPAPPAPARRPLRRPPPQCRPSPSVGRPSVGRSRGPGRASPAAPRRARAVGTAARARPPSRARPALRARSFGPALSGA